MLNEKRILELKGIYGSEFSEEVKSLLFKKNKSLDGIKFNLSLKKGIMEEKKYNEKLSKILLEKDELKEFKELLEGGKNDKRYVDYSIEELKNVSLSFIEKGINSLSCKKSRYVDNGKCSKKEEKEILGKLDEYKEIRNNMKENEKGYIKNEEIVNVINKIEKMAKMTKKDILDILKELIKE